MIVVVSRRVVLEEVAHSLNPEVVLEGLGELGLQGSCRCRCQYLLLLLVQDADCVQRQQIQRLMSDDAVQE